MATDSGITVGQLAEHSGTTAKTIRFYEQTGLIPLAPRANNGYRTYSTDDIGRLRFIRTARSLGLSLNDLREVLALRDHGQRPCQQMMSLLDNRLSEIDQQIRHLRALRAELRTLMNTATSLPIHPHDDESCVCDLIETKPRSKHTSEQTPRQRDVKRK